MIWPCHRPVYTGSGFLQVSTIFDITAVKSAAIEWDTEPLVAASSGKSMMGASCRNRILSLINIEELADGETGYLGTPGIESEGGKLASTEPDYAESER